MSVQIRKKKESITGNRKQIDTNRFILNSEQDRSIHKL